MLHSHNRKSLIVHRHLMMSLVAPAMLLAQLNFSQNSQPDWDKRIALYAKPAVVRIATLCYGEFLYKPTYEPYTIEIDGSSLESGYFINPDGYIATNAHVTKLVKDIKNEKQCEERLWNKLFEKLNKERKKKLSIEDVRGNSELIPDTIEYIHHVILPNGEQYPFEIKALSDSDESDKDISIIKIEVNNAPALTVGSRKEVQILDPVIALGYPFAADINFIKLVKNILSDEKSDDKSANEATVTTGQVANPNKKLPNGSPVLQIDVSLSKGSLGGPVVNQQGEVIGLVTFHGNRQEDTNGIPFAVTAATIREFIGQAGTTNEPGVVDELYRKGLDLYWQGDYRQAKAKFADVKNLFPQHSEVDRLIRECDQKIAEDWRKVDYPLWILGIAAIAGGPLLVYFLLKGRSSGVAKQPISKPHRPKQRTINKIVTGVTSIFNSKTITSAQPMLELRNQNQQVLRFGLHEDEHKLGRDRSWSDLYIKEDEGWEVISRCHAILRQEGKDYRFFDGDGQKPSSNGTFINKTPIDPVKGHLLKDGDEIEIGQYPHNKVLLTYFNPTNKSPVANSSQAVQP